ncbi:hypothetical protein [Sphingobacterium athyrii]|uniref:Colicin D immunity protein domain-containing protein n=1 Tax=Sphingobacterium athyrii TaxID=2152717 RepID=A0A363P087_9SPHI|nr:hypothetical protein [Sphingobacterium athyrii]PUV26486.1 hypothetical protein DCO56_05985 [Sphingobacterium athyrii]
MVDLKKVQEDYLLLLQLVQSEMAMNTSVESLFNYLKSKEGHFTHFDQNFNSKDLLEFIRTVNRYADEFLFSDQNNAQIRKLMNSIYENLG